MNIPVGNKTQVVRALLDTGSQKSYILEKTARRLGIRPVGEIEVKHQLFGGTWMNKSHKRYSVRVEERTGKFGIKLNLVDARTICTGVSRMQKGPWMNELSETDIWISDVGPDPPDIEMLIGNDVFGRLLTRK